MSVTSITKLNLKHVCSFQDADPTYETDEQRPSLLFKLNQSDYYNKDNISNMEEATVKGINDRHCNNKHEPSYPPRISSASSKKIRKVKLERFPRPDDYLPVNRTISTSTDDKPHCDNKCTQTRKYRHRQDKNTTNQLDQHCSCDFSKIYLKDPYSLSYTEFLGKIPPETNFSENAKDKIFARPKGGLEVSCKTKNVIPRVDIQSVVKEPCSAGTQKTKLSFLSTCVVEDCNRRPGATSEQNIPAKEVPFPLHSKGGNNEKNTQERKTSLVSTSVIPEAPSPRVTADEQICTTRGQCGMNVAGQGKSILPQFNIKTAVNAPVVGKDVTHNVSSPDKLIASDRKSTISECSTAMPNPDNSLDSKKKHGFLPNFFSRNKKNN